jgi:hypothetical protein
MLRFCYDSCDNKKDYQSSGQYMSNVHYTQRIMFLPELDNKHEANMMRRQSWAQER